MSRGIKVPYQINAGLEIFIRKRDRNRCYLLALSQGKISGGKFLLNLTMGGLGFTEFAPISAVYFAVDAFYPEGVSGFKTDLGKSVNQIGSDTINGFKNYRIY